ncbi:MAG: glycosyltransferase WbuB [Chloroflexi bacterium]|nr:MAG: glycosyltransferase WbuB [Chloroflexota bacterium]MBL1194941.1 glycosyltransferase WbuB [Chloroflexota bacterium]NOH12231.1 glycosyltransferase family 4 protein [Chloroflexota bacterium]
MQKAHKVCHLVHQSYYRDGRVKRYVESLIAKGDKVDVICVKGPKLPTSELNNTKTNVYEIPFQRINGGAFSYPVEYLIAFLLFSIWLTTLHLRNRYDVVHVHNMPDFFVFAAFLPRISGSKVILDIHDPMPEFFMSKFETTEKSPIVKTLIWEEKLSTLFAHEIIAANENFRNCLIRRGVPKDKISIVLNIPDPFIFSRDNLNGRNGNREEFILLYTGTLAPRYGLELPVRALPLLVKDIPNVRLLLVGPNNTFSEHLVSLAEELGVGSYLTINLPVPIEQVPVYMNNADIGIYPALPDSHMSIAIPSKVLEYAFMGLPILAARLLVLENYFSDTAIEFFNPKDVKQFADKVIKMHSNTPMRESLAINADREFTNKHSWEQEFSTYQRLLD